MKSFFSSTGAVLLALASGTCCIGPLMAFAGMIGVSGSQLIWLASIKNYLVAFSLLAVCFNLYRAYFPVKNPSCCALDENQTRPELSIQEQKTVSFFQSKRFLWGIAILTILLLIIPYIQ